MVNRVKSLQTGTLNNVLFPPRLSRMYDNEAKNGTKAYTVSDLFNDLRGGIFAAGKPDVYKRNLQRAYIEDLKSLLVDDFKGFPGFSSAQLASFGFTPINMTLSDIRPMVRAELKAIDKGLPKGGDALTAEHYADLHARIADALNPNKPVINLPPPSGRGVTLDLPVEKSMEPYDDSRP